MDETQREAPHCPEDDTVMLSVRGGWECPECGHVQQLQDVELPPDEYDEAYDRNV